MEKKDRDRVTVKMEDGREVTLKVKKRTRVVYPRVKNMSSEYGVGTVLITLDTNGDVAATEIVRSEPEDDTPPETIPPFQFGVSFDFVRRR